MQTLIYYSLNIFIFIPTIYHNVSFLEIAIPIPVSIVKISKVLRYSVVNLYAL